MRAQLFVASLAGEIAWRILPRMHQRVCANVRQILGPQAPQEEVERLARRSWRNYLLYLREFVSMESIEPSQIAELMQHLEGGEHVQELARQGRGPVIVSAHFGNWDLAAALGAQVWRLNVIADTFKPPRLNDLVTAIRTSQGVCIIPIERAVKRTIRALRKNEAVAFLVDRPLTKQGVSVEFFGRRTQVPGGAGFFAIKAGAPILPAFVWRDPDKGYSGRIWPPIDVEQTGDLEADMRAAMQQVMRVVEEMIRSRPEHWYMFRKMWPEEVAVA